MGDLQAKIVSLWMHLTLRLQARPQAAASITLLSLSHIYLVKAPRNLIIFIEGT
jgi:hypothetical protein